jgi:hypothetical protein
MAEALRKFEASKASPQAATPAAAKAKAKPEKATAKSRAEAASSGTK